MWYSTKYGKHASYGAGYGFHLKTQAIQQFRRDRRNQVARPNVDHLVLLINSAKVGTVRRENRSIEHWVRVVMGDLCDPATERQAKD